MMGHPVVSEIRQRSPLLSVGVISADMMNLGRDIERLNQGGVELLHFDVMDGHFAPPLTVGGAFIKGIRTPLLKDVHLMIEDPLPRLPEYIAAGADLITVHAESGRHLHRALQVIGEAKNVNEPGRGILRGIALNPDTTVGAIAPLLELADLVMLVAVNPGFGGQRFIEGTRAKLTELREQIETHSYDILVGIDGGVTRANIAQVAELSPDIVVTGSAVFENGAIDENLATMHERLRDIRARNGGTELARGQ